MRSALICVFLTLLVQREGSLAATENNFRPTPIPLDEWHHEKREDPVGTSHETIHTAAPSTVATLPVHYWEDALRHSVYLTLVRDKIDQLIAKSEITSPNSKGHVLKEVDDQDLWDKIKNAPFDRIQSEEPEAVGDVTIMAKGKLMNEAGTYRFTEYDKSNDEKCSDGKCKEGVKAIWSVKRVRQRDREPSSGRYHYELTFSVITQSPKKEKKPYENPMRTFTVRETYPEKIIDTPQESHYYQPVKAQTQRPEKAIWFHKNISHKPRYPGRQYNYNLDRIFTSFFSDDDYEPQPKPKYVQPVYPQHSKVGYVGASSEHYHQKKLLPYPYKPNSYKYSRHPLPPPPPHVQHHYLDIDAIGVVSNPYLIQNNNHRHVPPHKSKAPRPQFLPTPIATIQPQFNLSIESSYKWNPNITDSTTKATEIITGSNPYSISKPAKFNYFPDHVRTPVYNAPPGVFVTMDKKPFKPMPPLRLIQTSKPSKIIKPTDFRPSPQLLDIQFSEPDPFTDTAFRPITVNYVENNTTEKIEAAETVSHDDTKPKTSNRKKPPKKHENIKTHRLTTNLPEVMTIQTESEEERDTMQWANILGAFTKTTPMVSQKAKHTDSTTSSSTSTTVATTTAKKRTTTTTKAPERKTTTTTTTPKSKKRTRPPPKFSKPEKIKKHQRITSTTTKAPQNKLEQDLTPQASSAATSTTKPWPYPWNKAESTTTSKPSTTTKPSTTSTTSTSSPVTSTATTQLSNIKETIKPLATKQISSKNRYRQSTLMQKGTSIKHDKWSAANQQSLPQKPSPQTGSLQGRRKASNFQGYIMTSTPTHSDIKEDQYHHKDHAFSESVSSTTEYVQSASSLEPIQQIREYIAEQYENNANSELEFSKRNEEGSEDDAEKTQEHDGQESRDHSEYIIHSTLPTEETNEINIGEPSTTEKVTPIPKPKCNKMKHLSTTTKLPLIDNDEYEYDNDDIEVSTITSSTTTTTEKPVTPDIFDELFGGFTFDDTDDIPKENQTTSKPMLEEQETTNNEQYLKIDDEFKDFLDGIKGNKESYTEESDEQYGDETSIDDDEMYEDDMKDTVARENSSNDDPEQEHPLSLLELIAME